MELEVLPACQGYGLGVLPWSPLHGGLLGGILRKQAEHGRRAAGRAAEALPQLREQVEAYEQFCADLGEEPARVALAWLLHQPAVTAPDRRAPDAGPAGRSPGRLARAAGRCSASPA